MWLFLDGAQFSHLKNASFKSLVFVCPVPGSVNVPQKGTWMLAKNCEVVGKRSEVRLYSDRCQSFPEGFSGLGMRRT